MPLTIKWMGHQAQKLDNTLEHLAKSGGKYTRQEIEIISAMRRLHRLMVDAILDRNPFASEPTEPESDDDQN